MQTTAAMEGSVLKSDKELLAAAAKMEKMSGRVLFRWISFDVVAQALLATIISGAVYLVNALLAPSAFAKITLTPHEMTGFVLGLLLTARIAIGSLRAYEASAQLSVFCKSCRSLAVFASHVSETLTISAGAELEKKAVAEFRYELVRLLNLAWYLFKAMLLDVKVEQAPVALRTKSKESQMLSASKNPTMLVIKSISKLLERQQAAGRMSSATVALFSAEIGKLIETYHVAQSYQLSPPSTALEGFVKFFTVVFVYTVCPIISLAELSDNAIEENVAGFILSMSYSLVVSLFYFGLYEAGKLVEKPFKAVMNLIDLDTMTATLSDDLASLVDDPDGEVPVFLPKLNA